MSSEWPVVRLEDVTTVLGDGLHGTPTYDDLGDYYFVNGNNLRNGRIIVDDKTRRTSAAEYKKHRKDLNDRTILVSINGTLGNVALYGGEKVILGKSACYFNVRDDIDKQFVRYVITGDLFQEYIHNLATGSTIKNVSLRLMRDFSFKLPPLYLQNQVSVVLTALDDRITLLRETNATLEAIAQALFKSWFVDFDPVRAKAQGRQPEGAAQGCANVASAECAVATMDPTTAALFPDTFEDSELGPIPKGWRYVSLKEATEIFDSKRIPLSGQERDKRKGQFPYYGAAALMDWVDDYLFDGIYLLTGEDGSVADASGYPITQYVWGRIWVNNHAHVLQGKGGVSTEHLMLSLKSTNITPYINGAVQAKLSQSNMWRIPFLWPANGVAEAFGSLIAPLFKSVRYNSEQAQTLTQLRDTLLPRLISGQLRLPEAEAQLEEALV